MSAQEGATTTPQQLPSTTTHHPPVEAPPADPPVEAPPAHPRLQKLHDKHAQLQLQLSALQAERAALVSHSTLPSGLPLPEHASDDEKAKIALDSANAVIKEHIQLLHGYNEIKDIGQGLMGFVADTRSVRIKEVMEDYGMADKD